MNNEEMLVEILNKIIDNRIDQKLRLLDHSSSNENEDELIDNDTAAELLQVKSETLQIWRSTKRYDLPYIKIGRNIRYRVKDINDFIKSRTNKGGL